ncbi:MAG: ribbon-helix-helix domain-containing protein [Bifidobacteriaceae bacterium]|jgi:plasmid stability protein|nr:ribbon-helix-helix domain-containing protein [Bifidobacteriaceae bacterium]
MTHKTTIYLDDDIRSAIRFAAVDQRLSEAEVIRRALRSSLTEVDLPAPQGGVFDGGQSIDWESDDALRGFGEW